MKFGKKKKSGGSGLLIGLIIMFVVLAIIFVVAKSIFMVALAVAAVIGAIAIYKSIDWDPLNRAS